MQDVMIDIETAGTKAGCPVLSIGAVYFDMKTKTIGEKFYASMGMGAFMFGTPEQSTMDWWDKQSSEARNAAFGGTDNPLVVVEDFCNFLKPDCKPWGNGSVFDMVILEAWFDTIGKPYPWKFWNIRDVRTAVDLLNINTKTVPRVGDYHNALDDCLTQVNWLFSRV